jgi:predicted O-methyltransferase YrrM
VLRPPRRLFYRRAFHKRLLPSLPPQYRAAALLVFTRRVEPDERAIAREIDSFRPEIPALAGKEDLVSHPSPHSGTFSTNASGRGIPAPPRPASVEAHMRTGINPKGGLLLRRVVVGTAARRILELGTNTGFSGRYFLSSPACEWLDTVEGSEDLCNLARMNLARSSDRFRVLNMSFDHALEKLRAGEHAEAYDAAFLDGQHEREATLHYVDQLVALVRPGGTIILDDIYWSEDMNRAWRDVCRDRRFPLTIDFATKGVAVTGGGPGKRSGHFDLCQYIGRPRIYRKGW